jgi:hypothetical protein
LPDLGYILLSERCFLDELLPGIGGIHVK